VTEEPDPIFNGRVRYQRMSKSDFRSAYENQLVDHRGDDARHYVALDNGFQVVTEEPDPIFNGRVRYQRMSKSDFRSAYENQLV
ncbi:hypothetical protein C7E12_21425, partial [Stenotrophomonas maltophilia]